MAEFQSAVIFKDGLVPCLLWRQN